MIITDTYSYTIRWRCYFYLNPDTSQKSMECYGFKSTRSPPQVPELKEFEDELLRLVRNVKFRPTHNPLQRKLVNDIHRINQSQRVLVPADKTTNFYQPDPNQYKKLLTENRTKDYTKSATPNEYCATACDKRLAVDLGLDDWIPVAAKREGSPSRITNLTLVIDLRAN